MQVVKEEILEEELDAKDKGFTYDHSKSFFRNLVMMIREIKVKEDRDRHNLAVRMSK